MSRVFLQYVRDRGELIVGPGVKPGTRTRGNPIGVVYARKEGDDIFFGWSKWHKPTRMDFYYGDMSKQDKAFDAKRGKEIAMLRLDSKMWKAILASTYAGAQHRGRDGIHKMPLVVENTVARCVNQVMQYHKMGPYAEKKVEVLA